MKFIYKVKTESGEDKTGEIEANNINSATDALRRQKLFITSIQAKKDKQISINFIDKFFKKVKLRDKVIFTQQLAVMIKSGFPLVPALKTLQKQTDNKYFHKVIGEIADEVKGGAALSACLEKRPNIFPSIYSQVAKSGEKSGKLDKVLLKLSKDLIQSYDLNTKIKSALIYPIFILVSLVVVVVIIMILVIPQLESLFKEVDATLPIATRILIGTSKLIMNFWWLILLIVIGLIFTYQWIKKIPKIRSVIDDLRLKIPIFGQLQKKVYLARFARTLSTLSSAGLPILDSFDTLKGLTDNVHLQKDIEQASKKIEAGAPIGQSLGEGENFPVLICEMITIGEKAGNLDYVLRNLAKFMEKDVDYISKNLTVLLEPILMIIMGVGVAFILLSILGPIYNLVQVIQ